MDENIVGRRVRVSNEATDVFGGKIGTIHSVAQPVGGFPEMVSVQLDAYKDSGVYHTFRPTELQYIDEMPPQEAQTSWWSCEEVPPSVRFALEAIKAIPELVSGTGLIVRNHAELILLKYFAQIVTEKYNLESEANTAQLFANMANTGNDAETH